MNRFKELKEEILDKLTTNEDKRDLLLLLIKQLTELKSNYYIRAETIYKISQYIREFPDEMKDSFYEKYLQNIKKLLEINSDTSKSAWFNRQMTHFTQEDNWNNLPLPQSIFERVIIENTRSYYNGICRLQEELPYIAGGMLSVKADEKEKLKETLLNIINSAAYRDFKSILEDDRMITVEGEKVILDEKDFYAIISNVEMLRDIQIFAKEENEEAILKVCSMLAIYMRNILKAKEVQMMIEIPMECDEWREELKKKYNNIVSRYARLDIKEEREKWYLKYEPHSDYLLLANGHVQEREEGYVRTELVECLREYRKEPRHLGFWINEEKKYLIWEFGQKSEHQILLYAEWDRDILPYYLQSIQHAMSNYYKLNDAIFSKTRRAHIHELLLAEKDSLVYNQEKAHTHTKSGIRMNQHGDVQNNSGDALLYRSHVMTLLADLAVSHVYRQSLKKRYYSMERLRYKKAECSSIFDMYKENSKWLVIKPEVGVHICVSVEMELKDEARNINEVYEIDGTESILCTNACNARKDMQLLIHALIMNVAGSGRGKGRRIKNADGTEIEERVVYLVKTKDGSLRIMNETDGSHISIESINTELKYPPRDEKHGISMWSVSRYFCIIWNIGMQEYLKDIEKGLKEREDSWANDLSKLKNRIEKYLDNDFMGVKCGTIFAEDTNGDNRSYFFTDVPIFEKKYIDFFKKDKEV